MTSRPHALVLAPFRGGGLARLEARCEVTLDPWIDHTPIKLHDTDELAARIEQLGATILVCEADEVAGPVLEQPLAVVAATRGDPTNVDIPTATARGIPVLHAPGRNADAVAELTVALLLAAARRVTAADRDVRAGEIYKDGSLPYQRFRGWELAGRTAAIVGYGAIGRALAWRLAGLGMVVLTYDPYADDATHADLDAMLAEADVVSLHAPVTEDTRGMFDERRFARLRGGAIFLNAARADLHDHDALVAALADGRLGAAGLDHFTNEYLAPDDPLCGFDNVVLTPHIGGATYDTEANHSAMIADDILALLDGGTPRHCANPEVLT
ncbi:MAG: 3-phosphoglycerate dehydrogenase [Actinobacteria bacterium]|nr:3-phosphoglycerate dehydrogenase [Actinomycetota bacterium]